MEYYLTGSKNIFQHILLIFCETEIELLLIKHETLGKSEGFGLRDFFPTGCLPAINGR